MRLRQLRQSHGVAVVARAFLLRPEENPQATFTDYHLQHRFAARLRTGLPYHMPQVGDRYPRSSWPALEAARWVARHAPAAFDAFDLALFEGFFQHTRDISDPTVLEDVARSCGIAPSGLAEALAARTHGGEVEVDHAAATRRGIQAVPTALFGDVAVSGAVEYEVYASHLQRSPS